MAAANRAAALEDLRVVEFAAALAGPWIGRIMACCGAEVIRVESKKRPDVVRGYVPPRAPEMGVQPQLSPWFTDWNAGKRFVALDLTQPAAVEISKRLVASCDVVIENYSAGVMEKLGLGYSELRRVRPDLVMISTSGYGDSGPHHRYITWGPNIEALSGLSKLSGFPGRECTMTQYAYPDTLSALHGLFAVMCALDHRSRTGAGQYISLSQTEATVAVIGDVVMDYLASMPRHTAVTRVAGRTGGVPSPCSATPSGRASVGCSLTPGGAPIPASPRSRRGSRMPKRSTG
jgi:benzylsuccinate CoA-transferase BbsF subunit